MEVARAGDLRSGTGRSIRAGDRWIALFRDGDEYLAIDDTCPHQGASLGEGTLHEGRVICPWHSWVFDVRTGVCPRAPDVTVPVYAVRRSGDVIEVELPDEGGG